ncbi:MULTISPECIES: [FeFe] hydrogenase, group A [Clostridium]|uniref:4Fe-4S dicluster domain-containing protein n=1 Tax=Clostridium senegalense TaxID=1465809 RepID=A0A6M0GZQ0_9CLOT|nr:MULTISPECIES: [FeFe] hydrogenase, group A [Clostridium]NEU04086.1 4Fe-4S dicluster domain-containing protein [Clostridium senegalense]
MGKSKKRQVVNKENLIDINKKKCIGCTACAINCTDITGISVLKSTQEGKSTVVPKMGTFEETGCIYCGQCTLICPTTAITARNDIEKVEKELGNGKYMVAFAAPALKATLGEEFNLPIGSNVEGKVQASARKLGFEKVFDTDFGADVTVIEEGTELIKRLSRKENLPMFTSCCSSWVRYVEIFRPELINNLSTCKSPQQIMGASIKTYFANKFKILPENIYVVSIKPCTSKKYEAERDEMGREGYKDIDTVLTVREYGELLRSKGIDITALPSEPSDSMLGEYTGAGVIFGLSSGVMEATLRTVAYYLNDDISKIEKIQYSKIDGTKNSKEAEVIIGSQLMKVAVISGLSDVEVFLKDDKWKEYTFVEVMSCPGGCINGGGTPRVIRKSEIIEKKCIACGTCIDNCPVGAISFNKNGYAEVSQMQCVGCTLCSKLCRTSAPKINVYDKGTQEKLTKNYIDLRKNVLRNIDEKSQKKVSVENKEVKEMYDNYIGNPDEERARLLFHTQYKDRSSELKINKRTCRGKKRRR